MGRKRSIKVNVDEVKKWMDESDLTAIDIDRALGATRMFHNVVARGTISKMAYRSLCMAYKLPEGSFLQTETTEEKADATAPSLDEETLIKYMKYQTYQSQKILETMNSIEEILKELTESLK